MGIEKKIEALKEATERKRQSALDKTNDAIARLLKEGKRINFQTVAQAAGVSVTYLYKYDEIKERINHLRKQQEETVKKPTAPQSASDKSKQVIINQLRERVRKLESENQELRTKSEAVYGRLYQLQSAQQEAEVLRTENARLKAEANCLKEQLDECRCSSTQHQTDSTTDVNSKDSKVTSLDKKRTQRTDTSDRVKFQLAELGIKLNSTLTKKIKSSSESRVLAAIEALKQAMQEGEVRSLGGWLARAIEDGWTKNESQPQLPSAYTPPVYKAPDESESELLNPEQMKQILKGVNNERNQ